MKKPINIIIIISFITSLIFSQNFDYEFDHYHKGIHATGMVATDTDIWISSCVYGLICVNKQTFDVTYYKAEDSQLPTNRIIEITKDKDNTIWMTGFSDDSVNYLISFDQTEWHAYNINQNLNLANTSSVNKLAADNDNCLWFSIDNKLCKFNINENYWAIFNETPEVNIDGLFITSKGEIVFGSCNSIVKYNHSEFITLPNMGGQFSFVLDKSDQLWKIHGWATQSGIVDVLKIYDGTQWHSVNFPYEKKRYSLNVDKNNNIWLLTIKPELTAAKISQDKIITYYDLASEVNKFSNNERGGCYSYENFYSKYLVEDDEHFWMIEDFSGYQTGNDFQLTHRNLKTHKKTNIRLTPKSPDFGKFTNLTVDENKNLYLFSSLDYTTATFKNNQIEHTKISQNLIDSLGLPQNRLYSVYNNSEWFVIDNDEIDSSNSFHLIEKQNDTYHIFNSTNSPLHKKIDNLFIDSHNRKWMNSDNKLLCYNDVTWTTFEKENYDSVSFNSLGSIHGKNNNLIINCTDFYPNRIAEFNGQTFKILPQINQQCIDVDENDDVWCASLGKLYHYLNNGWNESSGFERLNHFDSFIIDSYGHKWFYYRKNVNIFKENNIIVFDHSTTRDYFIPTSNVRKIVEDKNRNLWILHKDGISIAKRKLTNPIGDPINHKRNSKLKFTITEVNKNKITIQYSHSNPGKLSLSIYDLSGQKISTLFSDYYKKGENKFSWNLANSKKQTIGNGMFVFVLSNGKDIVSQKICIVR